MKDIPQETKIANTKWVFKVKGNNNGDIEIFKARLVIQGFMQTKGINYDETFAPVIGIAAVRIIIATAAATGQRLFQIDIATAYQNGLSCMFTFRRDTETRCHKDACY